ncbi:uncharacterized protein TNCV_242481 [Trichonephila clavipes]|uniref:Reverse transcriptase domain-containing protein n=1 Tax=Trichonephila clavipes TaxID=2585209 RepID=A0A8X7BES5_TRICX|nr:uncharacterized protein TNCV_242481 [Trichonephila clavipes]
MQIRRMNSIYRTILCIKIIPLPKLDQCLMDRQKNSSSINECFEKGPNMVELIPTIINKFRLRKFSIIADIETAFLQIGLQEKDRPFLRFLWWENGDKEKKIYQHKRVVFGITSSPFLLGATLEHHLKQRFQDICNLQRRSY